jgi:hypothetical protein
MKFCYLDESGTGTEPYAVMVGVVVDSQRMNLTKAHWEELLLALSKIVGRTITEIHTCDFYAGNGPWRGLVGEQRAKIISAVFGWLQERKHHIVYSTVDKTKFNNEFRGEPQAREVGSLWRFMALHTVLAIQKHFQSFESNKGNTVLIFDNEEREAKDFTQIVKEPPEWTDSYYNRAPKQGRLDQIVDVPYFGDSRQVSLIQVADFVSFFMRRYAEVREGVMPLEYTDEAERLDGWIATALARVISKSAIYPSRGRCECADLFYRYAPKCLL